MSSSQLAAGRLGILGAARRAVVTAFDDDAGLGELTDESGTTWPFHCTAVADGSRHVEVGAVVWFRLAPAPGGRIEARDLVPAPPGA